MESAKQFPVVTVLGPRQSGKTTLCRTTFPSHKYFSFEDPDVRRRAIDDPRSFLAEIEDFAILDEIQRIPELLSYLQGVIDSKKVSGRYILTRSHQPMLSSAVSQSLAGRTAILELWTFSFHEIRKFESGLSLEDVIIKGRYPRVYDKNVNSGSFYNSYIQTYLERDVHSIINLKVIRSFERFLSVIATRVGQLINYESISNKWEFHRLR